jgi:phage regulator Rha-like protein
MDNIVRFSDVRDKIITIRDRKVILDSDVAEHYGVETKRINEAVKNNPDKFPEGYILELSSGEYKSLRSKFSTLNTSERGKHTKYLPHAFTDKGLYMLATILKSERATQATIDIIEAFARLRELQDTVAELAEAPEESQQKSLMQKSGDIIAELLDSGLKTSEAETSIELNFAVLKFKHTVKRKS